MGKGICGEIVDKLKEEHAKELELQDRLWAGLCRVRTCNAFHPRNSYAHKHALSRFIYAYENKLPRPRELFFSYRERYYPRYCRFRKYWGGGEI